MYFDIQTSRARKTFKRLLGQTNHYLITILVGLDYIKENEVSLPEEFRTSWNPKDKKSSSIRSRELAIKATLTWAIDSLDAYLGHCHRKPSLYQEKKILEEAGAAGQSVDKKFMVLSNYVKTEIIKDFDKYYALTNLALKWRNKLIHFFAENEITLETRKILTDNHKFYYDNFQGLEIKRLLEQFDNSHVPRFKEITSIIRGIHKFVELSDEFLLNKLKKELHFIECFDFHFKLNTENEIDLKKKTALIYNLKENRRRNSLNQTIMNYGFTKSEEESTKIKEDWVTTLASFKLEEIMAFLNEEDYENKKEMIAKINNPR
jgi:hypothetical protein